jgi:imidazolonepropionase-like amidohydrolase|tara:strand:+ start:82 stop:426 length:345 start_codon:yes stop_codon:yes gene_type:complete
MNFLIRNVKLIDGTGTESVPRVNVAVQEGVISWIDQGPIRHFEYPHYEDINGEDLTLVPGLFDCHEHFAGDGGQFGVSIMADESDDIALIFSRAVSNARRALIGGQTPIAIIFH